MNFDYKTELLKVLDEEIKLNGCKRSKCNRRNTNKFGKKD